MIYFPGCGGTNVADESTDKVKFASTVKNFINFVSRRCNRKTCNEDFIHPTLDEPLPQCHSDAKSSSKKHYFMTRGQQNELQRQVESGPSKKGDRSRSNSNPVDRIRSQSNKQRSRSIDVDDSNRKPSICVTVKTKTSSSTVISQCITKEEIKGKVTILCCDKCDGRHETAACPHYKKTREVHLDGQKNGWKLIGEYSTLPGT